MAHDQRVWLAACVFIQHLLASQPGGYGTAREHLSNRSGFRSEFWSATYGLLERRPTHWKSCLFREHSGRLEHAEIPSEHGASPTHFSHRRLTGEIRASELH